MLNWNKKDLGIWFLLPQIIVGFFFFQCFYNMEYKSSLGVGATNLGSYGGRGGGNISDSASRFHKGV